MKRPRDLALEASGFLRDGQELRERVTLHGLAPDPGAGGVDVVDGRCLLCGSIRDAIRAA